MHALRVARGATGRELILKFEGAYHGAHDAVLVALKPQAGVSGGAAAPLSVPASKGIPRAVSALTVAATFNDLDSVGGARARHRGAIAAVILGYNRIIADRGLDAHATGVGSNGCVYFTRRPVKNYRDFLHADAEMFWRYFFGMLNRGIIPCGQFYDEQWTISVAHTDADIDAHLEAFGEVAADLGAADCVIAKAQAGS